MTLCECEMELPAKVLVLVDTKYVAAAGVKCQTRISLSQIGQYFAGEDELAETIAIAAYRDETANIVANLTFALERNGLITASYHTGMEHFHDVASRELIRCLSEDKEIGVVILVCAGERAKPLADLINSFVKAEGEKIDIELVALPEDMEKDTEGFSCSYDLSRAEAIAEPRI